MGISIRDIHIDLFNGTENITILHLSDLHLKLNKRPIQDLENIISNQKPNLIVLTGDYYDLPYGAILFKEFLLNTAQFSPIIFIRGNHDFWFGGKLAESYLGIPNTYCVEEELYVFTTKLGNVLKFGSWKYINSMQHIHNEKNIILTHKPNKVKKNISDNINLILAGHLHGSQIILHKTKKNTFFPGNLIYKNCTDYMQINKTKLIVSKGIGDTLPLRINCPREIVKIRIS